jgi:hypothetical protein
MRWISQLSSKYRSVASKHRKIDKRLKRNRDQFCDQLMIVMRGFRVKRTNCSEERPAGPHNLLNLGDDGSKDGATFSSSHPEGRAACPVTGSCLANDRQQHSPLSPVFDVRFIDKLCATCSSECFEAVHAPQKQHLVDYDACSSVSLQGNSYIDDCGWTELRCFAVELLPVYL